MQNGFTEDAHCVYIYIYTLQLVPMYTSEYRAAAAQGRGMRANIHFCPYSHSDYIYIYTHIHTYALIVIFPERVRAALRNWTLRYPRSATCISGYFFFFFELAELCIVDIAAFRESKLCVASFSLNSRKIAVCCVACLLMAFYTAWTNFDSRVNGRNI